MQKLLLILLLSLSTIAFGNDTLYARKIIKFLTSKACFGRGYVKNGLQTAEKFLVSEIVSQKTKPLFNGSFTQSFTHKVNIFKNKVDVSLDGTKLTPGKDFILDPTSTAIKGKFSLTETDSVTHKANSYIPLTLKVKNKLTYSVGGFANNYCEIELNKTFKGKSFKEVSVNISQKVMPFKSNNIGCYIDGTSQSDSCIVFSAHYDHLGGMGKNTFFPGANDNASGVSVILNLIKYYKTNPPKYKTIFILFAAEEAGLLGSEHFVKNKSIDLSKIKFLLNLDLLGTGDDGFMLVNGAIHTNEFDRITKINNEKKLVKQIKKRGKAQNSDHYWFTEAGVPCFFLYTLGGIAAYHDVDDIAATLPLTDYVDVFNLITEFISTF